MRMRMMLMGTSRAMMSCKSSCAFFGLGGTTPLTRRSSRRRRRRECDGRIRIITAKSRLEAEAEAEAVLPLLSKPMCVRGGSTTRFGTTRCKALQEQQEQELELDSIADANNKDGYYQGVYGAWTVEPSDVREVVLYRTGLVVASASFVAAAAMFYSNPTADDDLYLDLLYSLGAAGLGLSLYLIHIYVAPIKRALQALWALGAVGSVATYAALARPAAHGLVRYVVSDNPSAVWLVGPLFAALTGLVFKEGLCYGKLEAGFLTLIIPTLLLGHLSGVLDDGVKMSLLASWMALFVIFAARKFTQPIKDDIGDKSVFIFNALPEEEKKAFLDKLERLNS